VLKIGDLRPETVAWLGQGLRGSPGLLGSDRPRRGPRWPRAVGGLSALAALGFCGWIASGATSPGPPERVSVLWALVLAMSLAARVDRRWKKEASAHLEPGLDLLDPLHAERARWGRQPAAERATPGEWPGRVMVAAGAGLLALVLVLGAEGGSIYWAAATQNSDTLARLTQARTLLAGLADETWLRLALDSRDERRLVHYSIAGQHPGRAREVLAALDGSRCQSDACWEGVRDACEIHGRLDVGLLERSMPYRSNGSPIPLGRFAQWCPEALPNRELARLDLRNASLSPPMLELLWGYALGPDHHRVDDDEAVLGWPAAQKPRPETPEQREIGAEARALLLAVYAAEREEVRRREPSPWAQAQDPLLELLATRDTNVSFKVLHDHAPASVKPAEIPAEITSALRNHGLHRTTPLLRLHETRNLLRETPTLTLEVTWQQRTPDAPPR
jgi:hypothetical protein